MSKSKGIVAQIEDLLHQIDRLDQLIAAHGKANHQIEVKQFESLKLGFVKELLVLLINSSLNISEPQTFPLVNKILENFYPATSKGEGRSAEYLAVESVLSPVLGKKQLLAGR